MQNKDAISTFSVNIVHPMSYALGLAYTFVDGAYTLIYTSYCSRFGLFRFGRNLLLQSSTPEHISSSNLIYVMLRNLPHFTLLSFVLVKFCSLLVGQLRDRCGCCESHADGKAHQRSLVASTCSNDLLLTPDYQTKPEFLYTQGT